MLIMSRDSCFRPLSSYKTLHKPSGVVFCFLHVVFLVGPGKPNVGTSAVSSGKLSVSISLKYVPGTAGLGLKECHYFALLVPNVYCQMLNCC